MQLIMGSHYQGFKLVYKIYSSGNWAIAGLLSGHIVFQKIKDWFSIDNWTSCCIPIYVTTPGLYNIKSTHFRTNIRMSKMVQIFCISHPPQKRWTMVNTWDNKISLHQMHDHSDRQLACNSKQAQQWASTMGATLVCNTFSRKLGACWFICWERLHQPSDCIQT